MHRWKEPAVPRHVVQAFVVDTNFNLLLMHRSDKVRSAKNVWSIPSGEHEIGETAVDCLYRELEEEYGLVGQNSQVLDLYENIAGDDLTNEQYHWVISLYAVLVDDVTRAINREPDKHDRMLFLPFEDLRADDFLDRYQFHPTLQKALAEQRNWYIELIDSFIYGSCSVKKET